MKTCLITVALIAVFGIRATAAQPDGLPSQTNRPIDLALLDASRNGDLLKAKFLVLEGANVNCLNIYHCGRPLNAAAMKAHNAPLIHYLVRHHAKVNGVDGMGSTPLIDAADANDIDNIQALLDAHADIEAHDPSGFSALTSPLANSKTETYLLSHGANPRDVDREGLQPLHHAVVSGSLDFVRMLVQRGVDVNAVDTGGDTPLAIGGYSATPHIVEYLIAHGASIKITDKHGLPVWMNYYRSEKILPILLRHGANINERSRPGLTVLDMAARDDHRSIVEALIAHGANVNLRGPHGETPYAFAAKREDIADRDDVIQALIAAGETDATPIAKKPDVDVAANSPAIAVIKGLLEANPSSKAYVVVERDTAPGKEVFSDDIVKDAIGRNPGSGIPVKLWTAFVSDRSDSQVLPEMSDVPNVVWVRAADVAAIFKNGGWWDKFYKKYPKANGYMSVSLPTISTDCNEALIYSGFSCGGLCGQGNIYYMKKGPKGWTVVKTLGVWAS